MPAKSAGILLYRYRHKALEVLLVHPGGPWWAGKDLGAWSIPKGEMDADENPLHAAQREFNEETGYAVKGEFIELEPRRQPSGKWVYAWALEGDCDADRIHSNTCEVQWPPRSGKWITIPEVDRAAWMSLGLASEKILAGQRGFIEELATLLAPHLKR